jgi:electron transport complex protein RnfB
MTEDVYHRLAKHLDSLPGGYPSIESGVEIRILHRLFDEDEAAMAVHLKFRPETVASIAERVGMDTDTLAERLDAMSKKGLIYRNRKRGETYYSAAQFVIGIWEYHVNDLDEGLINDFNEYIPHLFQDDIWAEAPQLRTIPIGESVEVEREILPYEQAESIIHGTDKIAVAPCICRKEHKMVGEGCERPEEVCLVFDQGADYYVENGLGRYIDESEAMAILEMADETGLVLQPGNAQRTTNICCCCGCCCQVLLSYKRHPQPASLVSSPYIVATTPDLCIGCGDCIDRCQMQALSLVDDISVPDLDRCIGCGLCVTTCTSGSLHMVRKPLEEQPAVPRSMGRAFMNMAKARGLM